MTDERLMSMEASSTTQALLCKAGEDTAFSKQIAQEESNIAWHVSLKYRHPRFHTVYNGFDINLEYALPFSSNFKNEELLHRNQGHAVIDISLVSQFHLRRNVVDYEMLCLKKQTTTVTVAQRWKPPEADVLKVNIDGSFFSDSAEGGSGFIVRDNSCNAVGSGAGKLRQLQDPMHAEAEACLHAIQEAQTWAMRRITRQTHRNW
ncbi:hypothetical protein VPH35_040643 [Triticum aestivum]